MVKKERNGEKIKKKSLKDNAVHRAFPLNKGKGCSKVLTKSSMKTRTPAVYVHGYLAIKTS